MTAARQKKARAQLIWAAFNPETGYVMAPTMAADYVICKNERDRFYEGCPIYQCRLIPNAKRNEALDVGPDRGGER